jgi:hypothetical protein
MAKEPIMSGTRIIRYTTKPESADENERLIQAVFAELAKEQPPGISYTASRLEDGVSFMHVVTLDGADNPLMRSPAFAEFQREIGARCSVAPVATAVTVVGDYPSP